MAPDSAGVKGEAAGLPSAEFLRRMMGMEPWRRLEVVAPRTHFVLLTLAGAMTENAGTLSLDRLWESHNELDLGE